MPRHDKSQISSTMLLFAKSELASPSLSIMKGCFLLVFALKGYVLLLQCKDVL